MIGEVIGSYRIVAELGKGGMGVVYRAEHIQLGRPAALKMLQPQMSSDAAIVQRFFNEARAASAIDHPGIVEIYDFGRHSDGRAYIVMALLRGESLEHRLVRGPLAPQEGATIVAQAVAALAAAHARGIVHRDLKPDNIFLVPNDLIPGGLQVKLLDFGIAKLADERTAGVKTQTGALIGTPAYMSPEQCMGRADLDHRTDIYSVGCILFHVFCGRPPFISDQGTGMMIAAHLRDAAPDPRSFNRYLPEALARIILRCLEKDPAARFQSADELRNALVAAGANAPPSRHPGTAEAYAGTLAAPPGAPGSHAGPHAAPMAGAPGSHAGPHAAPVAGAPGSYPGAPAAPMSGAPWSHAGPHAAPISGAPASAYAATAAPTTRGGAAAQLVVTAPTPARRSGVAVAIVGLLLAGAGVGAFVATRGGREGDATSAAGAAASASTAGAAPAGTGSVAASAPAAGAAPAGTGKLAASASTAGAAPAGTGNVAASASTAGAGAPGGTGNVALAGSPTRTGNVAAAPAGSVATPAGSAANAPAGSAAPVAPAGSAAPVAIARTETPGPTAARTGAPSFRLDATAYAPGDAIEVRFAAAVRSKPQSRAWITVIEADRPAAAYGTWTYVEDGATAATLKAPTRPGAYEVRLHTDYPAKAFHVVHAVRVSVGSLLAEAEPAEEEPEPAVTPLSAQRFTLAAATVRPGGKIDVRFATALRAAPRERFWITVVAAGARDDTRGAYDYVPAGARRMQLTAPAKAGDYEVRLHANYPTKTTNLVHRVALRLD